MQLNPARGRKRHYWNSPRKILRKVYAAQPREGTETKPKRSAQGAEGMVRFMQLNPARGRKLYNFSSILQGRKKGLCSSTPRGDGNTPAMQAWRRYTPLVYAAQPREGTETTARRISAVSVTRSPVYAAQPREGTETRFGRNTRSNNYTVYAAQPREGTETSF